MDIEEMLSSIGITKKGEYSDDDTYTIGLSNSNEFGRISSILDKSDLVEPIEESSYFTDESGSLDYKVGDDYIISLIADFDNDYYTLVVTAMD